MATSATNNFPRFLENKFLNRWILVILNSTINGEYRMNSKSFFMDRYTFKVIGNQWKYSLLLFSVALATAIVIFTVHLPQRFTQWIFEGNEPIIAILYICSPIVVYAVGWITGKVTRLFDVITMELTDKVNIYIILPQRHTAIWLMNIIAGVETGIVFSLGVTILAWVIGSFIL